MALSNLNLVGRAAAECPINRGTVSSLGFFARTTWPHARHARPLLRGTVAGPLRPCRLGRLAVGWRPDDVGWRRRGPTTTASGSNRARGEVAGHLGPCLLLLFLLSLLLMFVVRKKTRNKQ